MNVLFVCTYAMQRSPTAAHVFSRLASEKNKQVNVKYAGISSIAIYRIDRELIQWADKIYVMEAHQKDFIVAIDKTAERKIEILHIPDHYLRESTELIKIFRKKLEKEI